MYDEGEEKSVALRGGVAQPRNVIDLGPAAVRPAPASPRAS